MKLSIFLLTISFAVYSHKSVSQQVTYGESFEQLTFLPSGWAQVGASISRWSRQSSSTFPTISLGYSGIGFARFQARGVASGTIQTIALPVADYRQRVSNTPSVTFYMYRDSLNKAGDSIGVYANTSLSLTGATHLGTIARYSRMNLPDTQIVNGWYKYGFSMPASFNGATNFIMLKGIGRAGNNIYLDSIWTDAYPLMCSGKPTGSTISSNPDPICGGSGNANLTLSGGQLGYTGASIAWQWSNNISGPWTSFGGTTATQNTGNLTISRFYRCILYCNNSGLKDTTPAYLMKVISTLKPTILVTPNPATYCSSSSPLLLVASGAKNYSWSPTTFLSDAKMDSVYTNPTNSAVYTVTGTDTQGCIGMANVQVTVRTSPTVSITSRDSNICIGDSLKLTATGAGITAYLWAPQVSVAGSITVKPTTTTTFIVAVKNNFNCSSTDKKTIYVKQKPIANFGYKANGNVYTFLDSSSDASTWHWQFGDGNESYKSNPIYTFSGDTMFRVTLIISDPPCANDTFSTLIQGNPALTKYALRHSLIAQPNPVISKVSVSDNGKALIGQIKITDATGREMLNYRSANNGDCTLMDLSNFAKGIYTLQILELSGIKSIRVVKL